MSELEDYFALLKEPSFQEFKNGANEIFQRFTDGKEYKLPTMVEYMLVNQAMTHMALQGLLMNLQTLEARVDAMND